MPPVPVLKAWRKQRRGFGKLTPHGTLGGSDPTIDAGGGRRRTLVDLEANVVEECGLGQGVLGDGGGLMRGYPPAQEMKQIVGITAQVESATPRIRCSSRYRLTHSTSRPDCSTTRNGLWALLRPRC